MIEVRPRSLRGVERTHGRLRQALLSAPTLVSVLLAASVIARILMARHVLAPWAMGDELRHSELANSFVATRHYVLREQPYHLPSIYPALISPAWLADSMKTTYALAKGFNVALMTAAAIPLYAWARRLVRPAYAILAVGVYLAIPSFVYTAEILTENAYVPAVVLALLVLALALERPTIPRQLLALALAALVVAIRVQGIVFAAIIPTAIGLKVLFDLRAAAPASKRAVLRQTASRWSLPLGLLVLAAVVYAAYEQLRGASLSSGLGIYSAIAHSHYTLQDSARWVTYHFGELAFSVGAIPFSALVLLVGLAFTPTGTPRPVERAFVRCGGRQRFLDRRRDRRLRDRRAVPDRGALHGQRRAGAAARARRLARSRPAAPSGLGRRCCAPADRPIPGYPVHGLLQSRARQQHVRPHPAGGANRPARRRSRYPAPGRGRDALGRPAIRQRAARGCPGGDPSRSPGVFHGLDEERLPAGRGSLDKRAPRGRAPGRPELGRSCDRPKRACRVPVHDSDRQ